MGWLHCRCSYDDVGTWTCLVLNSTMGSVEPADCVLVAVTVSAAAAAGDDDDDDAAGPGESEGGEVRPSWRMKTLRK